MPGYPSPQTSRAPPSPTPTSFPAGPPKGGIPAVDRPRFVSVTDAATWLDDREPVLVMEASIARRAARRADGRAATGDADAPTDIGGKHTRAFRPGGRPHLPPADSHLARDRQRRGGRDSGDGDLLPVVQHRDRLSPTPSRRGTEFQHDGPTAFFELDHVRPRDRDMVATGLPATVSPVFSPARACPWFQFSCFPFAEARESWPEERVLSRDTGFNRAYGTNPYAGYDSTERPFLLHGAEDLSPPRPRRRTESVHPPETRRPPYLPRDFWTASSHWNTTEKPRPWAYRHLQTQRLVELTLGGDRFYVLWQAGTASALDTRTIAEGNDVGSANAFFARTRDGRPVHLTVNDGAIVDETGSTWGAGGERRRDRRKARAWNLPQAFSTSGSPTPHWWRRKATGRTDKPGSVQKLVEKCRQSVSVGEFGPCRLKTTNVERKSPVLKTSCRRRINKVVHTVTGGTVATARRRRHAVGA